MVIRDLTLRSAASFGSFHLIRLLYDEYMFYLVEHRVAEATGETPIAVMGEVRRRPAAQSRDSPPREEPLWWEVASHAPCQACPTGRFLSGVACPGCCFLSVGPCCVLPLAASVRACPGRCHSPSPGLAE